MQIHICPRSFAFGLTAGALALSACWYGTTLAGRAAITTALLDISRCDERGFVAITFADASQFTCAPRETLPPTSRAQAQRRGSL